MTKILRRKVVAIVILLTACSHYETSGSASVDQAAALQVASAEFLRHTKGQITKYRAAVLPDGDNAWRFRFAGDEEFLRPGYHWFVLVDKKTGKARVLPGE